MAEVRTHNVSSASSSREGDGSRSVHIDLKSWRGLTAVLQQAREANLPPRQYAEFRDLVLEFAQKRGDQALEEQIRTLLQRFTAPPVAPPNPPSPAEAPASSMPAAFTQSQTQVGAGMVPDAKVEAPLSSESFPTTDGENVHQDDTDVSLSQQDDASFIPEASISTLPPTAVPHVQSFLPKSLSPSGGSGVYTPSQGEVIPYDVEESPVPPLSPEQTSPVAPPAAVVIRSPEEHRARIVEIKRIINTYVPNPVALVELSGEVGRRYMGALLNAMKATNPGSTMDSNVAMRELEEAFEAVKSTLATARSVPPHVEAKPDVPQEEHIQTAASAPPVSSPPVEQDTEIHEVAQVAKSDSPTPLRSGGTVVLPEMVDFPQRPNSTFVSTQPATTIQSQSSELKAMQTHLPEVELVTKRRTAEERDQLRTPSPARPVSIPPMSEDLKEEQDDTIRFIVEEVLPTNIDGTPDVKLTTPLPTPSPTSQKPPEIHTADASRKESPNEGDASTPAFAEKVVDAGAAGPQEVESKQELTERLNDAIERARQASRSVISKIAPHSTPMPHGSDWDMVTEGEATAQTINAWRASSAPQVPMPQRTAGDAQAVRPNAQMSPSVPQEAVSHTPHGMSVAHESPLSETASPTVASRVTVATSLSSLQSELSSPAVTEALNQLLHQWSIFASSGVFGIGPGGKEHPLYEQLCRLTMGEVLAGRWEGADRQILRTIKDYVDAWRHEQGIAYNPNETFEHYLRRVVLRILKRQQNQSLV